MAQCTSAWEAKALLVGTALGWRRRLGRDGLQAQYFPAEAQAQCDRAVRQLPGPERGTRNGA
ncbi:MAG: hypothetical protein ACREV3_00615 [Gammaproteobacteria bacterium]